MTWFLKEVVLLKAPKRMIKWLYPGLGLKRWALFGGIALGLIILGLWSMVNNQKAKQFTYDAVHFMQAHLPDLTFWQGLLCTLIGMAALVFCVLQISSRYMSVTRGHAGLENYYENRSLAQGPNVVVIGGGTGLSVLLKGLKTYTSNITAAVTVGDDGGSSGRLRQEFDVIPVGDIRNCIVALADEEDIMEKLFSYRFAKGTGLKGHSLGNLLLLGLTAVQGNFQDAVSRIGQVLHINGRVLPITNVPLTLVAKLTDGRKIVGECNIGRSDAPIDKLSIRPEDAQVIDEVLDAIHEADAVILGPGSLYTSVIPNLCVKGVVDAIDQTQARVFYICNVMTQSGETDGYTVSDHLEAILRHGKPNMVNYVLADDGTTTGEVTLADFLTVGSEHVVCDEGRVASFGAELVKLPLVSKENPYRHDTARLAEAVMNTLYEDTHFRRHRGFFKSFWDFQKIRSRKEADS